jgi:hypothetical protein
MVPAMPFENQGGGHIAEDASHSQLAFFFDRRPQRNANKNSAIGFKELSVSPRSSKHIEFLRNLMGIINNARQTLVISIVFGAAFGSTGRQGQEA